MRVSVRMGVLVAVSVLQDSLCFERLSIRVIVSDSYLHAKPRRAGGG